MRRSTMVGVTTLVLALATSARSLSAQELRGRAVDADTEAPVVGAMIIALDEAGEPRARTLTDDRGDFRLRLSASDELHALEVVRIGYASQEYLGQELSLPGPVVLRVRAVPVELAGIGVVAEGLCGDRFAGSGLVYDIWLETRKALEMTRLTQSRGTLDYDAQTIARVLDPDDLSERERRVVPRYLRGETPYYSLSEEEMRTTGWVAILEDESLRYWAPDAAALLSTAFEEQHCFGAEFEGDRIVLRFAPNREREGVPDIQGEILLDRASYRLQRLRFEYTSLPLPTQAEGHASGEVHFLDAPNGMWVVNEWWIRMPVLAATWRTVGRSTVRRLRLVELQEQGGRLQRIHTDDGVIELDARPPLDTSNRPPV